MVPIYEKEATFSKLNEQFENLIVYVEQAARCKEAIHRVEKEIFRKVQLLGYVALKLFVQACGTGYEAGNPPVSDDGTPLRYKDLFETKYLSIFGELSIERAGYHDESQARYHYPLDSQLNLPADKYSYLLKDWLLSQSVETDYRDSVELLNEIFALNLSHNVPKRVCQETSQSVDSFYEQLPAPAAETEGSHLCITSDCKGVRILKSERQGQNYTTETPKARRAKGEKPGIKKEAVVTADYSFNPGQRTPEELVKTLLREYTPEKRKQVNAKERKASQDQIALPRAPINKHQRATMQGKDKAMEMLMQRLVKRDPEADKRVIALIDGAPSLEKAIKRALNKYGLNDRVDAMILDIVHVCEYIWEAATAIHGEKSRERLPWVRKQLLTILNGKVGYVIGGLKQMISKRKLSAAKITTLKKTITYLTNHRHMMKYDQYLEKGYPIGTGVVEATCGALVKNRMERSGMRWKIPGAQAMLDQRAVKINGDWQQFWKTYIQTEQQRLYASDHYYGRKKAA